MDEVQRTLRAVWRRHHRLFFWAGLVAMTAVGLLRWSAELRRLLIDRGPDAAIDLGLYHSLVADWFAGVDVYTARATATHPPASYVLLWPLVGWLGMPELRWLYLLTVLVALSALIAMALRAVPLATRLERAFLIVFLAACYPTTITIGNGQITTHLVVAILALWALLRRPAGWVRDAAAAALLLAVFVKPHFIGPFLWLILLAEGGWRVLALAGAGYAAVTAFALTFQPFDPAMLFRQWEDNATSAAVFVGHTNIHIWLGDIGLGAWILPASLTLLAAFGIWLARHRRADPWIVLGVTAIVARLWTYHGMYDDLLFVLPMLALAQIAGAGPADDGSDVGAAVLLLVAGALLLAPATPLRTPGSLGASLRAVHAAVWLSTLAFLHWRAGRTRAAPPAPA